MVPVITIPASRAGGAAAFAVAAPHDRGYYHPYKEEEDGRSEGSLGEGALPPPVPRPWECPFNPAFAWVQKALFLAEQEGRRRSRSRQHHTTEATIPTRRRKPSPPVPRRELPTRRHRCCLHAGTGVATRRHRVAYTQAPALCPFNPSFAWVQKALLGVCSFG